MVEGIFFRLGVGSNRFSEEEPAELYLQGLEGAGHTEAEGRRDLVVARNKLDKDLVVRKRSVGVAGRIMATKDTQVLTLEACECCLAWQKALCRCE